MMFLIRMAFWLGLVLALLPSFVSSPSPPAATHADFSPLEAASAATATVSDMRQFCTRQPDACAVGAQAVTAFGQRAQTGAKMVYDFVVGKLREGDVSAKFAAPAGRPSQQTLTPTDLAPTWRGPAPHKEARAGGDA
jgi:hypothetical protein